MPAPRNCPTCHSPAPLLVFTIEAGAYINEPHGYRRRCACCRLAGPLRNTEALATAAWNRQSEKAAPGEAWGALRRVA
jgi:hypothetical protein